MFDADNGWATSSNFGGNQIYRTTDGGQTWSDVSPRPFPQEDIYSYTFAKPQTAWISTSDGLLITKNGGKSWTKTTVPFGFFTSDYSACRFLNDKDGYAKDGSCGAGSVAYNFYETHDGGTSWKRLNISAPDGIESPEGIYLSNYHGDTISFDPPRRLMIGRGEAGDDDEPRGSALVELSDNLGKTWRDISLPLPREFKDALTRPFPAGFFGPKNVVLPIQIFKRNADASYAFNVLAFYTTADGGGTWALKPNLLPLQRFDSENNLSLVTANDFVVFGEGKLRITHDAARSWEEIMPNIGVGKDHPGRELSQMDFVDKNHGWIILQDTSTRYDDDDFTLYKTTDGGKNWAAVPLKISPAESQK